MALFVNNPMPLPRLAQFLLVTLLALLGFGLPPASALALEDGQSPAPPPPPVTVAGSRILFTRDPQTGRINAHFMEGFHPDHVAVLKKQKDLATVFFTTVRKDIKQGGGEDRMNVPEER